MMPTPTSVKLCGSCILICLASAALGCRDVPRAEAPVDAEKSPITVRFEFDFGDHQPVLIELDDLPSSSTVADAMRKIQDMPDTVAIEMQGSGEMTFVRSINDLTTAGGEGWSYSINDQWAEAGIGATQLNDGDVIRWTHGAFDD
ncbi:MAG: DUF4430 domain-containing protein [Pirellulaceae bacterium]